MAPAAVVDTMDVGDHIGTYSPLPPSFQVSLPIRILLVPPSLFACMPGWVLCAVRGSGLELTRLSR